jgi:hypothetical protein
MELLTIAVIGAIVWVALILVSIALCRPAARSDAMSERFTATLR